MLVELSHHFLLPLLFITGVIAGGIDAIAGGGGLITLPVLLGVGVPPHVALGTSKLQAFFGTAAATHSYYKKGLFDKNRLGFGILFTAVGAIIGAVLIQYIDSGFLKKVIPVLLGIILLYTIFSPRLDHIDRTPKMNEMLFYGIFGILMGFYDGFFGPGTGSFWAFLLIFFLGFNLVKATAYTKAFNLTSNFAALVCFILGHNVDYRFAMVMAAGQLIGARLGAHFAVKKGAAVIRPIFILVVTATILTLVYKSVS